MFSEIVPHPNMRVKYIPVRLLLFPIYLKAASIHGYLLDNSRNDSSPIPQARYRGIPALSSITQTSLLLVIIPPDEGEYT